LLPKTRSRGKRSGFSVSPLRGKRRISKLFSRFVSRYWLGYAFCRRFICGFTAPRIYPPIYRFVLYADLRFSFYGRILFGRLAVSFYGLIYRSVLLRRTLSAFKNSANSAQSFRKGSILWLFRSFRQRRRYTPSSGWNEWRNLFRPQNPRLSWR